MKNLMLILLSLTTLSVFAEDVNIKGVDLKSEKATENRLSIKVDGNLSDNPQITINDKTLSIVIPNAHVATKIQRHFNDATTVTATQANRDSVSIKTTLPYSLQGKESLVNITLKDGSVDVSFPRVATAKVHTNLVLHRSDEQLKNLILIYQLIRKILIPSAVGPWLRSNPSPY